MKGECRFSQKCALYGYCVVCNQMAGYAYGHKPGGCYRDLVKNGQKVPTGKNRELWRLIINWWSSPLFNTKF